MTGPQPSPPQPRGPLTRDRLRAGFDAAAPRYDLMVALNPGYRRHLRRAARAVVDEIDHPTPTLLDLGCGSGLSTQALLGAARRRGMSPRIIAVDASEGMLAHARRRRWPEGVVFVQGMAESLPAMDLPPAHGVLACYLLRNVTDLDATLRGIVGCLAPGAPFVAEDYSVRASRQAQARWHLVNLAIIGPLARLLTDQAEVYEYLHRSVDDFCTMPELAARMEAAGFRDIAHRTVGGWQRDILHLVRGTAPDGDLGPLGRPS